MSEKKYCVVGSKKWNREHFVSMLSMTDGNWSYVGSEDELKIITSEALSYRYVFFLHWSKKVPDHLLNQTECVCFHMTDVPYGRGGSPLQNLIARGHRETKLTALRMTSVIDAGPFSYKELLSLEGSTAEEIFMRASQKSCEMALRIASEEPQPLEQLGTPVLFKRRRLEQSEISPEAAALTEIFDHIRMLDAEGYPHAYIDYGNYRIQFRRAARYHDSIEATVKITLNKEDK
jgi:methionyl-tRNA formyltransferase